MPEKLHVWWDLCDNAKKAVVRTNHPKYENEDYILEFDCGTRPEFEYFASWFLNFHNDIETGRINLDDYMKSVKDKRIIP